MKRCPNCDEEFDEQTALEGTCSECGGPLEDDEGDEEDVADDSAEE